MTENVELKLPSFTVFIKNIYLNKINKWKRNRFKALKSRQKEFMFVSAP